MNQTFASLRLGPSAATIECQKREAIREKGSQKSHPCGYPNCLRLLPLGSRAAVFLCRAVVEPVEEVRTADTTLIRR